MSIRTAWGEPIEIYCNGCGFVVETDTTDMKEAMKLLKKIYWKTRRLPNGQWLHLCNEYPKCKGEPRA